MGCLIYMPLILPLDAQNEREREIEKEKKRERKKSVSPCGPFVGPKMNVFKLLCFEDLKMCCCSPAMYNSCIPDQICCRSSCKLNV